VTGRIRVSHAGSRCRRLAAHLSTGDGGASSVEYAILVGFIAAVAAAAYLGLGQLVLAFFSQGKGAFE
jgi:Flp pilus assembly pilin Flp